MADRNPFGGKNPHGMYVPLTEDEIEVLERLADAGEYTIEVRDWGKVAGFHRGDPSVWNGTPIVVFGDKRISFYFRLAFNAPLVPQPVWYFDLEVWAKGHRLFGQRMATETGGGPLQIVAGVVVDLSLDIALDGIDPSIVKEIKPACFGLTTRHGNMRLSTSMQRLLAEVKKGEATVRHLNDVEASRATHKSGKTER